MVKVWKAKWIMDKDFYGLTPINVFHKQLEEPVLPDRSLKITICWSGKHFILKRLKKM